MKKSNREELQEQTTKRPDEKEVMYIIISDDEMEARVKFSPPKGEGNRLTEQEIVQGIVDEGISSPNVEVLQQIFSNREYGKTYVIAQGKEPIDGKDAQIEYLFNIEDLSKPTLHETENGQVDFKNIEMFKRIEEGEIIARKTPIVQGEDGVSVKGRIYKYKPGKDKLLPRGEGTEIDVANNVLVAAREGQLLYKGSKFVVAKTLHIDGDVGPATGNIEFSNAVNIKGSVLDGFSVVAGGDVTVGGTVEEAIIESKGNVYIKGGFQGRGEGKIACKGQMLSKFIQDGTVIAGGNVETESINYSTIQSQMSIIVIKGKGNITGGTHSAIDLIEAKTIGSRMGVKTILEIKDVHPLMQRYEQLQEVKKEIAEELELLEADIFSIVMHQKPKVKRDKGLPELMEEKDLLGKNMEAIEGEFEELESIVQQGVRGKVICKDTIFEGTEIIINNKLKRFFDNRTRCSVFIEGGEIKIK